MATNIGSLVEFEIQGAEEIQKKLDSVHKRLPLTLRTVLNNAARDAKKDFDRAYKKEYALKRGSKSATLESSVVKATSKKLNAGIRARGTFASLSEFQNSPNTKKNAAKGHVYKSTQKKSLELKKEGLKAWVLKRNGKNIILQRYPKGQRGKKGGKFYWFPTGYLPYMYFKKETVTEESSKIVEYLEAHARKQMRKALGQ